jgi:hypothetical protein
MPKGYKRLVRRRVWRRETEKGVEGLDQIAPFEHRPADRISGMICRVFHQRNHWQAAINANGFATTFTCALCGRSWYSYFFMRTHPKSSAGALVEHPDLR